MEWLDVLFAILFGALVCFIKNRFWHSKEVRNTRRLGKLAARMKNGEPSYSIIPDLARLIEDTNDQKKKKELIELAEKLCENATKRLKGGAS